MYRLAVIITAHNCAGVLERTLAGARRAVEFLHDTGIGRDAAVEVIVVDDGSRDDTPAVAERFIGGKPEWKLIRRERATSPSAARNAGVAQSQGDWLFFLDGDDLYLPMHLAACVKAVAGGGCDFVKTGVRLADPVHPDWKPRMAFSIVINLCLRRRCHEFIGGFPDYHLYRRVVPGAGTAGRDGEVGRPAPSASAEFVCERDIFYKLEDQYYNLLVHHFFPGRTLEIETVEYCRYPGNGYDRHYAKFCRPFGAPTGQTAAERAQVRLCEAIVQNRIEELLNKPVVSSQ
jgi:glycosyltransferase involved in cell wall biosynthesis